MSTHSAAPLFHARHVTKRYGELCAISDVSLQIEAGEIFALLGPNGAGKTTLIGCISGLVSGFEGSIEIAGYDVHKDYRITRRLIGLVPQEINQDVFFSVRDSVAFQGGYFGVRSDHARIDELLESFSLLDKAQANPRWLSGGMKRRLMICKALVHDPVLLFLDEPTAGVDVELREELWEYVLALRERGTTIVLTTHYLEEAERLADRIGILHQGRLLRVSSREALLEEFGTQHLDIFLRHPITEGALKQILGALPGVSLLAPAHLRVVAEPDSPALNALLEVLVRASIKIASMESSRSSLEDVFRDFITAQGADDVEQ